MNLIVYALGSSVLSSSLHFRFGLITLRFGDVHLYFVDVSSVSVISLP